MRHPPRPLLSDADPQFTTSRAGAKENKRNKLENEKRKEIQSFRQDPQVPAIALPSSPHRIEMHHALLQVLLAKIEALESGKEGSGYEVQKKIQE